jgi:hypothetical protein
MKFYINIISLIIFSFCLFYSGCTLFDRQEEQEKSELTLLRINGKVLDRTTSLPIVSATVELQESGLKNQEAGWGVYYLLGSTKTDSTGRYYLEGQVEDCDEWFIRISACSHPQYGCGIYDGIHESLGATIYVRCTNELQTFDFRLTPY